LKLLNVVSEWGKGHNFSGSGTLWKKAACYDDEGSVCVVGIGDV